MMGRPVQLSLDSRGNLQITWDDGDRRSYTVAELRDRCPCATCREKRAAAPPSSPLLPVLAPQDSEALRLTGLNPVGSYAYGISFSDGHDTGIFTLEQLKSLGVSIAGPSNLADR